MTRPTALLFALVFGTPALLDGCQNKRPVGALRNGPAECIDLALDCKAPADALGEPYQDCYDTGAARVGNACINVYYTCIAQCHAASADLPNAGGAAGDSAQAGASGEAGTSAGGASGEAGTSAGGA